MKAVKDWNWRLIGLVAVAIVGIALLIFVSFEAGKVWNQRQAGQQIQTVASAQSDQENWDATDPWGDPSFYDLERESQKSSDVISDNGKADLPWLRKLIWIIILIAGCIFISRVLSGARARGTSGYDGLAKWLGATWGVIFGPSPRPSPLLWASNFAAAIFAALLIFFFWSDILVICLIPVAIIVAILFWVGKGALVGEALEGIFTGFIIKKIIKDPAKSAEEAKQNALAKLYKELHDNDEVANPEREETIKNEIAVLRGEKS